MTPFFYPADHQIKPDQELSLFEGIRSYDYPWLMRGMSNLTTLKIKALWVLGY